DVKSDQKFAGSDDAGAGRRMQRRTAEIRRQFRVFETAAAHVFERGMCGVERRCFVEINWNAKGGPDSLADAVGDTDAVFKRGSLERNERRDIGGADAGVHAAVTPEIDELN